MKPRDFRRLSSQRTSAISLTGITLSKIRHFCVFGRFHVFSRETHKNCLFFTAGSWTYDLQWTLKQEVKLKANLKNLKSLKDYSLIHLNSETETLFSKQGLKRIAAYEPRMGILGREPWFDSWSRSLSSSNTKILVTSQLIKLSTP